MVVQTAAAQVERGQPRRRDAARDAWRGGAEARVGECEGAQALVPAQQRGDGEQTACAETTGLEGVSTSCLGCEVCRPRGFKTTGGTYAP